MVSSTRCEVVESGVVEGIDQIHPTCKDDEEKVGTSEQINVDSRVGLYLGISLGVFYVILIGILKTDGIFFLQFQNDINASAADITLLYSVSGGLFFLGGPIYGAFFKLFGAKATLITAALLVSGSTTAVSVSSTFPSYMLFYGVIRGIGCGLAVLGIFTITGKSFHDNLSFVNNFYAACSSTFAAAAAPLIQHGIEVFSWKGVMLLIGGFLLNLIPMGWIVASLYKKRVLPQPSEKFSFQNARKIILSSFNIHILKDGLFILYCLANSLVQFTRVLHNLYLVRYAQSIGVSDQKAAGFLAIYQITFITTTILVGVIMSKITAHARKNERNVMVHTSTVIIVVSLGICVVSFIPLVWQSYEGYLAYTILVGLFVGGCGSLPITILPELFGRKQLASAMGFRGFFYGIVNFLFPPIIGKIIDATGTYKPTLYATVFVGVLGSLLFYILQKRIDVRNIKRSETETEFELEQLDEL